MRPLSWLVPVLASIPFAGLGCSTGSTQQAGPGSDPDSGYFESSAQGAGRVENDGASPGSSSGGTASAGPEVSAGEDAAVRSFNARKGGRAAG